jgi:ATP-dependent RNA helicase RhlB
MTDSHLSSLKFDELSLAEPVARGVAEAGFSHCTPIQADTLPIALDGKDVAGQAQTGTGKTAAFLLAAFDHLLRHPPSPGRRSTDPRMVVLAPTRELAIQIHKDAELLGQFTGFGFGLAYGGTDYEKQRRTLEEGVDILIGTPGRLIDYFKQRVFGLNAVQVMVLDEADRMFDLGFIRDIRYVMRRLPPPDQRLNMLFSATLSHRVLELAYEHMNDPELVRIEPEQVTAERVRQRIFFPANEQKIPLLVGLLRKLDAKRTMVFVNMKREAERVGAWLTANGVKAEAMSGDVPQRKRQRMLKEFLSGDLPVLVATDVASRGLHIPGVAYVINYDLPQDAEDYVHRIGRTARAGEAGDAISFGCENYVMSLPEIEDYIGLKLPVENIEPELLAEPLERPPPRPRRERAGGERGRGGPRSRGSRTGGRGTGRSGPSSRSEASAEGGQPAETEAGAAKDPCDGAEQRPRKRRRRRRKPASDSAPTSS